MVSSMDDELIDIHIGTARVVRVTPKVKKSFDKWLKGNGSSQRKFKHSLKKYGEEAENVLVTQGVIKHEQTIKTDGMNIKVYVFKGWQARLYGEMTTFKDKKKGFIGVEFDQKKQDRADQNLLKQAANKLRARKG